MKPMITLFAALGLSGIQDLFNRPVTKQPIIARKGKVKLGKSLESLPNAHGKHIACLMGCGNQVAESVGICRSCRRAGKLHALRTSKGQRKDAAK